MDAGKLFEEVYNKVKPRTTERANRTGRKINGSWEYKTEKTTYIDQNDLYQGVQSSILNNKEYLNYIKQSASFAGQDPQAVLKAIEDNFRNSIIPSRAGVLEDSKKITYEADWREQDDRRFSHSLALMREKHSLDNPPPSMLTSELSLAKAGNQYFKPVQPQRLGADGKPVSALSGWFGGGTPQYPDVRKTIKEGTPGVNVPMLDSIVRSNPTLNSTDVWALYNEHLEKDQYDSRIPYNKFETTKSQKEDFERMIPDLAAGNRKMYRINRADGSVTEIPDDQKIAVGQSLIKGGEDKALSEAARRSLGKTSASSGHLPVGSIVGDPDSDGNFIVIAENRYDFINLQNEVLDPAFKWIQRGEDMISPAFPVKNKKTGGYAYMQGRKSYDNGKQEITYYESKLSPDGRGYVMDPNSPITKNGRRATSREIEEMLIEPEVMQSIYPHETKAAGENEFSYAY